MSIDHMNIDRSHIDWTHELVAQLDEHWRDHLRPRFDGLTDDEYRWEPVPGWNVRERGQAATAMAAGRADAVMDFDYPEPVPAPVTTIAWRMGHIAIGVFGMRAANHFGAGAEAEGVTYERTDWRLTAAGGLQLLDRHYDAWISGVQKLDAGALAEPCGPAEGPFESYSMAALVLHISREAIHHGAEIALLRDLYVHRDALVGRRP
jgi:hypothetical protein